MRWSGAPACTTANPLALTRLDRNVRCTAEFERSICDLRFVAQSTLTSVAIDTGGNSLSEGQLGETVYQAAICRSRPWSSC